MKRRTKTIRAYMIAKNGKVWNTIPEQRFAKFVSMKHLGLVQNIDLPFADEGVHYDFQLDFARRTVDGGYDIDVEIDGPNHDSDIMHQKDLWKDWVKNRQGLKVIHVPAELTKRKWWDYLETELNRALLSPKGSVYIIA